MNENKVSEERIRELIESSEKNVTTIFDKVTVVSLKLPSGFVITESSGCVDPENYDEKTGELICMGKIEDRLWELEGYLLQNDIYLEKHRESPGINGTPIENEMSEAEFERKHRAKISKHGEDFLKLANAKCNVRGWKNSKMLYAFELSENLWAINHDKMISLIKTDYIEETMAKLSRGRKYIIDKGTTEICVQEIDFEKFERYFAEATSNYKIKHGKYPKVAILSEKVFPVISETRHYIRTGSQSQFKGIEVVFSPDIGNVYDMFIF